jgi:hypothetical protein
MRHYPRALVGPRLELMKQAFRQFCLYTTITPDVEWLVNRGLVTPLKSQFVVEGHYVIRPTVKGVIVMLERAEELEDDVLNNMHEQFIFYQENKSVNPTFNTYSKYAVEIGANCPRWVQLSWDYVVKQGTYGT